MTFVGGWGGASVCTLDLQRGAGRETVLDLTCMDEKFLALNLMFIWTCSRPLFKNALHTSVVSVYMFIKLPGTDNVFNLNVSIYVTYTIVRHKYPTPLLSYT